VCLPDGIRYGCVTPADVPHLVAATEQRRIWAPLFRGRYGQPHPVQAMEHRLRKQLRRYGFDDVVAGVQRQLTDGTTEVTLWARGASHRVRVEPDRAASATPDVDGGRCPQAEQ
jgi:hypothetical protein